MLMGPCPSVIGVLIMDEQRMFLPSESHECGDLFQSLVGCFERKFPILFGINSWKWYILNSTNNINLVSCNAVWDVRSKLAKFNVDRKVYRCDRFSGNAKIVLCVDCGWWFNGFYQGCEVRAFGFGFFGHLETKSWKLVPTCRSRIWLNYKS